MISLFGWIFYVATYKKGKGRGKLESNLQLESHVSNRQLVLAHVRVMKSVQHLFGVDGRGRVVLIDGGVDW